MNEQLDQVLDSLKASLTNKNDKLKASWRDTLNPATVRLVALLFTRMGVLFSDKCRLKGLSIYLSDYDEDMGNVSEQFILWCQKLEGLNEEDFKRGMTNMESRQARIYAEGGEMWPPSYSEFMGLCQDVSKPEIAHYSAAYKDFDKSTAIEDKTAKEKRKEIGRKELSALLADFD